MGTRPRFISGKNLRRNSFGLLKYFNYLAGPFFPSEHEHLFTMAHQKEEQLPNPFFMLSLLVQDEESIIKIFVGRSFVIVHHFYPVQLFLKISVTLWHAPRFGPHSDCFCGCEFMLPIKS